MKKFKKKKGEKEIPPEESWREESLRRRTND